MMIMKDGGTSIPERIDALEKLNFIAWNHLFGAKTYGDGTFLSKKVAWAVWMLGFEAVDEVEEAHKSAGGQQLISQFRALLQQAQSTLGGLEGKLKECDSVAGCRNAALSVVTETIPRVVKTERKKRKEAERLEPLFKTALQSIERFERQLEAAIAQRLVQYLEKGFFGLDAIPGLSPNWVPVLTDRLKSWFIPAVAAKTSKHRYTGPVSESDWNTYGGFTIGCGGESRDRKFSWSEYCARNFDLARMLDYQAPTEQSGF
jgi:hypothetical protein